MAEKPEKVPAVVYVLGLVAGAISAFAVASEWLNQSFPPLAAVVGGLGGVSGVHLRESIFRPILAAVPAAVCIAIIIALRPVHQVQFIPNVGIPPLIGGFAGILVFNLWKVLAR